MILRLLSLATALGLIGLGAGFAWFVDAASARPPEPLPEVAGIAVLTGGPDRVEAGLRLALARPGTPLMISGVGRDADLASLARQAGVEPRGELERVTLGRRALSTRGNALEIGDWARTGGLASLAVVTAGFHMPRALLELRRALPQAALVALPVAPRIARPPAMVREYLKLLAAWAGLPGRALSEGNETP